MNDKERNNKTLEDFSSIVTLEAKRILSLIKKTGFVITKEKASVRYLEASIEAAHNRIEAAERMKRIAPNRFVDNFAENMELFFRHVMLTLYALNNVRELADELTALGQNASEGIIKGVVRTEKLIAHEIIELLTRFESMKH